MVRKMSFILSFVLCMAACAFIFAGCAVGAQDTGATTFASETLPEGLVPDMGEYTNGNEAFESAFDSLNEAIEGFTVDDSFIDELASKADEYVNGLTGGEGFTPEGEWTSKDGKRMTITSLDDGSYRCLIEGIEAESGSSVSFSGEWDSKMGTLQYDGGTLSYVFGKLFWKQDGAQDYIEFSDLAQE